MPRVAPPGHRYTRKPHPGENWTRHANPVSVWTRFAVVPLLTLSIWSRDWIGWWCLVPTVASLVSERTTVATPPQFTTAVLNVTYALQAAGVAVLAYGLVRLDVVATVAGFVIVQATKAWFIDRQVLLFEEMKGRHDEYARWEY